MCTSRRTVFHRKGDIAGHPDKLYDPFVPEDAPEKMQGTYSSKWGQRQNGRPICAGLSRRALLAMKRRTCRNAT
eukprot:6897827-Pyramimonas_sp.AAC.1